MAALLSDFLAAYAPFDKSELDDITGQFESRKVKKNEIILTEGEVCNQLIFVNDGCLRLYYVVDEVEITVWFAFGGSSSIDIYSFISGLPSTYFIQAIEDSEIMFLPKSQLDNLYLTNPKIQEMMRKFWEDAILTLIERFTALQKDTAEQRYLNLLKKPEYLQKIPQKYLASFIGVTPTSLSRIRKNIR